MGSALDTISGFVTAPGSTFTPWTLGLGDTLQIRNANPAKRTLLMEIWAYNQGAGTLRIRSPKLHDNVQGIRANVVANQADFWLAYPVTQVLYPQDILIAEQTGSSTAGNIESGGLLVYYEDLPGVAGRFAAPADIQKRGVNVVNVELALTPSASGGYSGQLALNAQFDLLQANTDYACIGYVVSARATSVCLRGPDTGNLRCSGPCEPAKKDQTCQWFWMLSNWTGIPLCPIINSANKAGTYTDIVQNQAALAVTVNWIFVQLAPASS
jgi:hypothetical protein